MQALHVIHVHVHVSITAVTAGREYTHFVHVHLILLSVGHTFLGDVLPAVVPGLALHPREGGIHCLLRGELSDVPQLDGLVLGVGDEVAAISL